MPATSRTAVVRAPGGPDSIEIIELPVPEPGSGDVRVEVAAAAVNPVDLAVADGTFHGMGLIAQPDHTGLGWDFAGVIDAAGPGVDLPVGGRVAGLAPGFDRDRGAYAQHVVVAAGNVALVPEGLDLDTAASIPLNGLAAAQIVDLLGDGRGRRLLVTGAAGAVGGYAIPMARDRGWLVTGLARAEDEAFVRSVGAEFTGRPEPGWDAVADAAALQVQGLALVRDDGLFVGVRPASTPAATRGITVRVVETRPDDVRLRQLLDAAAEGRLPARVHAVIPLDQVADAHRAVAKGGVRGRYVLRP